MIIFRLFLKARNFNLSNYVLYNNVIAFICVRGLKQVTEDLTKMSRNNRFFRNPLPDCYNNESVSIPQGWLVQNIQGLLATIEKGERPDIRKAEGGLYVGIGGIAYMYYHLSKIAIFSDRKEEYVKKGLEYITAAMKYTPVTEPADLTGFLLGYAGIHAVAAALYKEAGK